MVKNEEDAEAVAMNMEWEEEEDGEKIPFGCTYRSYPPAYVSVL